VTLQLEELSFIELAPDGSLTILGTQPLDSGDYQCIAANDAGDTSDTVRLDVGCMSDIRLTYLLSNLLVHLFCAFCAEFVVTGDSYRSMKVSG